MTGDQRFQRRVRLLQSRDYQRVFRSKQCKSTDRFLTLLALRNELNHPRLGLAITKKKVKTAVARQRLKRLIRESFRRQKKALSGLDIVVMSQSQAAEISNDMLFGSLARHWEVLVRRCKEQSKKQ